MKEVKVLGIREKGIDPRYNRPRTVTYSLFECPVCGIQKELPRSKGLKQNTCIKCRNTQLTTHGHSGKKYYFTWQAMKDRCYNPKNPKYRIYGGKGVKLEDKWLTFEGFWEDMGSTYEDGLTIDRIDSSIGYCKTNCRWITKSRNSSETTKRKPVMQLQKSSTPYNYEVVAEWESAQKAAESLGLTPAHITAVCKGQRQTHGGFGWQYKEI
jgi:hypothetical protein